MITRLLLKLLYFFTVYKNEWKGHKFRWQKNKKSDLYRSKKVTKINDTMLINY